MAEKPRSKILVYTVYSTELGVYHRSTETSAAV